MIARRKPWHAAGIASLLLALPIIGGAQTRTISDSARAAIGSAVSIQRVDIEPATSAPGKGDAIVKFQLKNISGKTIYAFGYSVTVTYADGSTQSRNDLSVDLLPLYFEQSLVPETQRRFLSPLLHPSETFADAGLRLDFLPEKSQSAPIFAQPSITMLIFEDRSAIGDSKAIQRIRNSRQSHADEIAGVIEDLQNAAQAKDPQKAASIRADDIVAGRLKDKDGNPVGWTIITDAEGKQTEKVDWRQSRAAHLKAALAGTNGDKSQILVQVDKNERYLKILKAHVQLTEVVR